MRCHSARKRFVKPVIGQPLGVPPRAFVVGVLGKTGGRVGTTDVGKMTTASYVTHAEGEVSCCCVDVVARDITAAVLLRAKFLLPSFSHPKK